MIPERGGIPAPFTGYRSVVRPDWIDENGHMNLAHYVTVLDGATDLLWAAIGLGETYRSGTGHGTFAAETHIIYRSELLLGQATQVITQVLGADAKRIHLAHTLMRTDDAMVAAQQEIMLLHVSLDTRRVVPFLPGIAERIAAAAQLHAGLPRPEWVGRRVAMPG
ncbi:MAG: thioesterase family protein, partial [Gemmatimonadaceae bacterium]|nr:thioesterase family protein [Acetobacteraceae bacterium]